VSGFLEKKGTLAITFFIKGWGGALCTIYMEESDFIFGLHRLKTRIVALAASAFILGDHSLRESNCTGGG